MTETLRQATATWRRAAIIGIVRMAILEQDTYWVPRAAWSKFIQASVQQISYHEVLWADRKGKVASTHVIVKPDWTVEGIVLVDDMDREWRTNTAAMIARQAQGTCMGMSFQFMLNEYIDPAMAPGEMAQDGIDREQEEWERLAHDDDARAAWLDQLPLMKVLMP